MIPVSGLSDHFSEMRVLLILFWPLTFFFARVAAIYLVLSHFASFYAMLLNPASLRLSNSTDYLLFFPLDLQDIMRCLLAKHPSYRPTLEEIAQHPWLQHQKHKPRSCPDRRACQSAPVPVDPIVDRRERRQRRGNSVLWDGRELYLLWRGCRLIDSCCHCLCDKDVLKNLIMHVHEPGKCVTSDN